MLDKAFKRAFFNQIEPLSGEDLDKKIEEVLNASKHFDVESEGASDAKFMLRHLRRIRAEKMFASKPVFMH